MTSNITLPLFLPQTFEVEKGSARRTVSRMIFNKEISGAWEHEPSETLVLHKVDPSSLQIITQQVAEKVAMLVESNERMLDPLVNVYGKSGFSIQLEKIIVTSQSFFFQVRTIIFHTIGFKDDQRKPWGGDRDQGDRRKGAGYKGGAARPNVSYQTDGRGRGRGGGRGGRGEGGGRGWGNQEGGRGQRSDQSRQPYQGRGESRGGDHPPRRVGWGSNTTTNA